MSTMLLIFDFIILTLVASCCCIQVLSFSSPGDGGSGSGFAGGGSSGGNGGDGDGSYYVHIPPYIPVEELNPMNFTSSSINHYTTIGMPMNARTVEEHMEELQTFLTSQMHLIQILAIPGIDESDCDYLVYASDTGGQLWGTRHDKRDFASFIPHFKGKSRINMTIFSSEPDMQSIEKDDGGVWKIFGEGNLVGVADWEGRAFNFLHDDGYTELGGIKMIQMVSVEPDTKEAFLSGYGFTIPDTMESFLSFSFCCPNFGCFHYNYLPTPTRVTIQLAGLAEKARVFDTVEEYKLFRDQKEEAKQQRMGGFLMSSQFFGTGAFLKDDTKTSHAMVVDTHAMVVGHIMETELRVSKLTGQSFYWALVKTACGMEIDVVIHPGLLERYSSKPPMVGGVFSGHCYLSGLLLEDEEG